ncbi:RIKEN cDNA 3110082I17, isoform CRA_a [Mus musculus]|nr:RIKEN cDNA 3110082I17, isoform CRA_a [Mus musculus]
MAKHKRKGLEGTGKESKRQKITPAEETPRTSEAGPDKETASTLLKASWQQLHSTRM